MQNYDALIIKIRKGIPIKTACAALRIPYTTFKDLYSKNSDFYLDVEQAQALALEAVVSCLYLNAQEDTKSAIEYLKKRDENNWADSQKTELIQQSYLNEILDILEKTLPLEYYTLVLKTLHETIE